MKSSAAKMHIITGFVIIVAVFIALPCSAMERRVSINPFFGGRVGGTFKDGTTNETLSVEEATAWGLTIDVDYDPGRTLQMLFSRQRTAFDLPSDVEDELKLDIDYYHFGGTYSWGEDDTYLPYVVASVGVTYFQPIHSDFSNEMRFSMAIGLGLKYFLTPNIGIVLEGRGYGTFMGGSTAIFCSGGCTIKIDQELYTQIEGRTGLMIRF